MEETKKIKSTGERIAEQSGYQPPTEKDLRDIKHDHNTAPPGSITADELVREETQRSQNEKRKAS